MTAAQTKEWVKEAITISRTMSELKERLEEIKADLVLEAERRKAEGVKTKGGGTALVMEGEECICRVVFPANSLVASFKKTDDDFPKIAKAAGPWFKQLFRPETVCKPMTDFRELAKKFLGTEADKLIELVEKESSPTVSFEVTESFGSGEWIVDNG